MNPEVNKAEKYAGHAKEFYDKISAKKELNKDRNNNNDNSISSEASEASEADNENRDNQQTEDVGECLIVLISKKLSSKAISMPFLCLDI
jgi:hypothetical protein